MKIIISDDFKTWSIQLSMRLKLKYTLKARKFAKKFRFITIRNRCQAVIRNDYLISRCLDLTPFDILSFAALLHKITHNKNRNRYKCFHFLASFSANKQHGEKSSAKEVNDFNLPEKASDEVDESFLLILTAKGIKNLDLRSHSPLNTETKNHKKLTIETPKSDWTRTITNWSDCQKTELRIQTLENWTITNWTVNYEWSK